MFLLLLLFWIVLNGRLTLEILLFGVALSAALYAIACRACGFSIRKDLRVVSMLPRAVCYFILLFWNIVQSNLRVIRILLRPHLKLNPCVVTIDAPLRAPWSIFLLANSITLTPSTISARVDDNRMQKRLTAAA